MPREITTKFKSCLEEDTVSRETVIFKSEEGIELGRVVLRQLTRGQVVGMKQLASPEEYLLPCIESWTFKGKDDILLPVTLESLRLLTSQKKVGDSYSFGILEGLMQVATDMNVVGGAEEKNSERP